MFTGLISELGTIERREESSAGAVLTIVAELASEVESGDSVAVDGACITVVGAGDGRLSAEVMNLTLALTALGDRGRADPVNLELAARLGDRLGGHIVQGHIDGTGTVAELAEDGFARRLRLEAPEEICRYVVDRGSIAVNGASLTIAATGDGWFEVSLIPETLERTNLALLEPGDRVNIECDVIARYVERLLGSSSSRAIRDNH